MASRLASAGTRAAVGSTRHLVPFHDSARRPLVPDLPSWAPIAMHAAGCAQEMPSRAVTGPALRGCRSRHLLPSQRMASGWAKGDLPFSSQPAATQVLWPGQDRPVRSLADVPGLGLGTTVHLVPFHVSVRLTSFAGPADALPIYAAAMQIFGVAACTR